MWRDQERHSPVLLFHNDWRLDFSFVLHPMQTCNAGCYCSSWGQSKFLLTSTVHFYSLLQSWIQLSIQWKNLTQEKLGQIMSGESRWQSKGKLKILLFCSALNNLLKQLWNSWHVCEWCCGLQEGENTLTSKFRLDTHQGKKLIFINKLQNTQLTCTTTASAKDFISIKCSL